MEQNTPEITREYGEQPLAAILNLLQLTNHQVVAASKEQLTHKMMAKACRGRYISVKVKLKVLHALNAVAGTQYSLNDLFNYR